MIIPFALEMETEDGETNRAEFELQYKGLDSMKVEEFVALLGAVDDLFQGANCVLNGDRAQVKVLVGQLQPDAAESEEPA